MRYNATRKVERQENAVMSSKVTKEKWESDDISGTCTKKKWNKIWHICIRLKIKTFTKEMIIQYFYMILLHVFTNMESTHKLREIFFNSFYQNFKE